VLKKQASNIGCAALGIPISSCYEQRIVRVFL